jgi:hypothetical protein
MRLNTVLVILALVAPVAGAAQDKIESWTVTSNGVDTAECAARQMTIDLAIDGRDVKVVLREKGRRSLRLTATTTPLGLLKTKVNGEGGEVFDITGFLLGSERRIFMTGNCSFGGRLTRKEERHP